MKRFGFFSIRFVAFVFLASVLLHLSNSTTAAQTSCVPPPSGLVGWWRGEGNAVDLIGGNNGTLLGNTEFGLGEVGSGFVSDGTGDGVQLVNQTNLQLQEFTIEAWISRADSMMISHDTDGRGVIFSYGPGGYSFAIVDDGRMVLDKLDYDEIALPVPVVLGTNLHHVAVTKSGDTVTFYADGVAYAAPSPYDPGFIFIGDPVIGARGGDLLSCFWGTLDEVSVYSRALSGPEIQAIFNAGGFGKCTGPSAPLIITQPLSQAVSMGTNASFTVGVLGSAPMYYQWRRGGTPLSGQTNISLTLTNVQATDGGNYSVLVTNLVGTALSSNALLTVLVGPTNCMPPLSGLISWWQGEGNAGDAMGTNNGTLPNGGTITNGMVGQALSLNGINQYISIPDSQTLRPKSVTVEGWFNFGVKSGVQMLIAKPFGAGDGDSFNVWYNGNSSTLWATITTTNGAGAYLEHPWIPVAGDWHHIAYTFDDTASNQVLYLDGLVAESSATEGPMAYDTHALQIGADIENGFRTYYLQGLVDEISLYNRALTDVEVQSIYAAGTSGKCVPILLPNIVTQPTNKTILLGGTASFSVTAISAAPLGYQWRLNGTNLANATDTMLTLTNVQKSQAGNYSVKVTNVVGSATSSNALLTVNFPPAVVKVASISNAPAGSLCTVPILMVANGNENVLGFSLNFSTALLTYGSVSLGSGAPGGTLFINTSQSSIGRIGVVLGMPAGATFAPGTQEAVLVSFHTAVNTNPATATLNFGDVPVSRQLTDPQGTSLAASFTGGTVGILGAEFEGDIYPRPNGNQAVTFSDWSQAGLYAARLDYPTNSAEFRRADCAPRSTLGDGAITVADWVQVGRYLAGLDPVTAAGGPTSELKFATLLLKDPVQTPPRKDLGRQISILNAIFVPGQAGSMSVNLQSLGNENAAGFSVAFDPAVLNFTSYTLGSGLGGASLNFNATQSSSGRLAAALALGTGSSFAPGSRELVKLNFRAVTLVPGTYPVTLGNLPVPCQVSDPTAQALPTLYSNAIVTINPLPALRIAPAGTNITLAWPLWASNFVLQRAIGVFSPTQGWINLTATAVTSNNERVVTAPLTSVSAYYRLRLP